MTISARTAKGPAFALSFCAPIAVSIAGRFSRAPAFIQNAAALAFSKKGRHLMFLPCHFHQTSF